MDELKSRSTTIRKLRRTAKRVLRPVLATAFYLLLSFGLQWLTNAGRGYPGMEPWRLPAGLALGLLLVYGLQYIPLAIAGQALATFWPGTTAITFQQALLLGAATTLIYVLTSLAIRRWIPHHGMDLLNPKHLSIFILMVPTTALMASAVTAAIWWFAGLIPPARWLSAVFDEAAANAAGILLMTPFALLLLARRIEFLLDRLTGENPQPLAVNHSGFWKMTAALSGVFCAFYFVLTFKGMDLFALFCLLSIPLVIVALKYGLPGVTVSLALFGCLVTGTARLGYDIQNPLWIHLVVIAFALNGLILGASVSGRDRQASVTRRQAALLNSVSFATEQLLTMTDKEQNVSNVLRYLAEEAGMTHTYVLENQPGLSSASQPFYEHWRLNSPVDADQAELLSIVLRRRISAHAHSLGDGEVLQYRTADLPEDEQALLSALNIRASIVLPIVADGRWWGCLGMDQCSTDRLWSESEISAFKATGRALAALLSHTNVEQQFRQLTGNIPAVFWIGAPDGLEKTYVSPAYAQIWGQPYESIRNNPRSWIATVYHEDYARISAALPKQLVGEYDEEYRIVRSDRSVRWIRETAFPVRDISGQVSRVVGIAQDITRQKEAEENLLATSLLLSSLIDNLHAGIVVEDQSRRIIHVNSAFCKMFDVAKPREALLGVDSRVIFMKQTVWASRINEIIDEGMECRNEEMTSDSGRVFNRDYFPLSIDGDYHYHLWRYEDITERKHSEEKIRTSLKEKEVLLKEIHHRVKNNLQVISSLLNLQASQIRDKETAAVFRDSQSRVKAMSLVHERLYQSSDLARIDFVGYVQDVTNHLLRSYQSGPHGIRLRVDMEPVSFNIDTAIPCALIINELVSNALKYAFPNGRDGEIRIQMNQIKTGSLSLVISDNGVGFPKKFSWEQTDSLGLQLVRSLTDQLNGTVEYRHDNGSQFDIRFRPLGAENRN